MSNDQHDGRDGANESTSVLSLPSVIQKSAELIQSDQVDQALELLRSIERDYIQGAQLFDLLGDALLRQGQIEVGIRYKTMFEVLRGTFRILQEKRLSSQIQTESALSGKLKTSDELHLDPDENHPHEEVGLPATLSMGHELMRQGHYDKALEIYRKLAGRNPGDPQFEQHMEKAKKKRNEKELLGVLQHWLSNIDQIKSGRTKE